MSKAPKLASNLEVILDIILQLITVLNEIFEFFGISTPGGN